MDRTRENREELGLVKDFISTVLIAGSLFAVISVQMLVVLPTLDPVSADLFGLEQCIQFGSPSGSCIVLSLYLSNSAWKAFDAAFAVVIGSILSIFLISVEQYAASMKGKHRISGIFLASLRRTFFFWLGLLIIVTSACFVVSAIYLFNAYSALLDIVGTKYSVPEVITIAEAVTILPAVIEAAGNKSMVIGDASSLKFSLATYDATQVDNYVYPVVSVTLFFVFTILLIQVACPAISKSCCKGASKDVVVSTD